MKSDNRFLQAVRAATLVKPGEWQAVLVSFGFVFVLMAAYYMLRPVRDAMASDWTNTEISQLWNLQFFLSAGAVLLLGVAVSRLVFKYLVQGVYIVFAASFVALHLAGQGMDNPVLINKCFYLWVSLFSLFHLSLFWSFMADVFNREQAERLFAFITLGASAGAILGPVAATLSTAWLGAEALIPVAAGLLLVSVPAVYYLQHLKIDVLGNVDVNADLGRYKVGGAVLEGFRLFATTPYLIGIAVFIALYTAIGSFAYFQQANLLRDFSLDQRTLILSLLSLTVNVLTFVLGFFVTGRLVTRFGMPATLAIMPAVMCLALVVLSFAPVLIVLVLLQVARQAGNYGITRPAREMLFTVVSRETRFKAKSVVDVVMYRGSDALWAICFAALTDGLGLGLATMAAIGAVLAALWVLAGVLLGRAFERRGSAVDRPAA